MHKNYTGYKVDQLLNDTYFVQWLLSPDVESDRFWCELQASDLELKEEIEIARSFVLHLRKNIKQPEFSSEDESAMWSLVKAENDKYKQKQKTFRIFRIITGVAAVICLCFWATWKFYLKEQQDVNYMAIIESTGSVENTSGEVELVLSERQKITIPEKESQVEYDQDGDINVNSKKVEHETKAEEKDNTKILNQLIVPYGKRSSVTFSDGTRIWVNSGSKVIYPVTFGKEKREIFVEGEVYLDVMHDTKWPFVVKTQQLDVKVLGTRFNVSAYRDETNLQVTLIEGKVEVNTNNKQSGILSPNQQLDYDLQADKINVQTVDVDNYTAWKSGYYQFEKQPLKIVFQKLSRYYGTQMEWDEAIGELTCSGKLDLKDDLNEVLNNLKKAAPIQVIYNGENIKISVTP